MAAGNKVKVDILDQNLKSCDTSFFVDSGTHDITDAGISAITTALADLISGGEAAAQIEMLDNAHVAGNGEGHSFNCADKIHNVCRSTVDGSTVIIDLPAPAEGDSTHAQVFNVDATVNQSCPAVIAMIGFINTNALDSNGNLVVWVSGKRTRSERLKTAY